MTAGIIRGAFETICFETAIHLGRAASSAIINQSNERNGSIIDAHGRLAGLSVGIPQLLFISPLAVRWGLEHYEEDDWGPGDVFLGNDPDHGGGHLPDYNVYAPCFDSDGQAGRHPGAPGPPGRYRRQGPGWLLGRRHSTSSTRACRSRVLKLVHRGKIRRRT